MRSAFQQILQVVKEDREEFEGVLLLSDIDWLTIELEGFSEP